MVTDISGALLITWGEFVMSSQLRQSVEMERTHRQSSTGKLITFPVCGSDGFDAIHLDFLWNSSFIQAGHRDFAQGIT